MATHLENNRTNDALVIINSGGAEGLSQQQFKDRYGVTPEEALSSPVKKVTKKDAKGS